METCIPMIRLLTIMLFLVLLPAGCRTTGVNTSDLELPYKIPLQYTHEKSRSDKASSVWAFFGNQELKTIVNQSLDQNFDLMMVQARLDKAIALLEKENAALLPWLDYSFGGQRKGTQVKKNHSSRSTYQGDHSWNASATGTWSPDIWGMQNASSRSAGFSVSAVENDLSEARSALISQMTQNWIDVIATRKRQRVLERQIKVNFDQLELQKLRYANGRANALDVSQQSEALASILAQEPLMERQEKILLNAMGLLSGKPSVDPLLIQTEQLPEPKPLPETGIPSELLSCRPDILAAQNRLKAMAWDVEAAEADLLPALSLSARAFFSNGQLDLLFQNWIGTLTAAITGTLFDGGLKKAEIKRTQAIVREYLAEYAKVVANAIYEVEDLLVTVDTQDRYVQLLKEELELGRLTLVDSLLNYWSGQSSYLDYLIVLINLEKLEQQLIAEKASALKSRVRFYQALGFMANECQKDNEPLE